MKKLKLNLANLQGTEVLTREQLKKVMGGDMGSGGGAGSGPGTPGGNNGNPCPNNCTQYCHQNTYQGGSTMNYYGTCDPQFGGTSCHNYCCEPGKPTYWC